MTLWSYAFAVSSKPVRTLCIYLKVHLDHKQGWGGAGAFDASFLSLPNREGPGACTCTALTLDISVWVSCVFCTCYLEWVGRELQTEIILQHSDSRSCARSVPVLLKGAAGTASVWQLLYYSNKFQLRFRPVAQMSNKKCLSKGNVWRDEML